VIKIDVQSFADSIEATRVFVAREPEHSCSGSLSSNIVGRSKRSAVIDDRASAKTFAGEQSHAVIGSGGKARFRIEISKAAEFSAVEIDIIEIATGFDYDNVFPRSDKNCCGSAAAGI
jgi:hypothetical protein